MKMYLALYLFVYHCVPLCLGARDKELRILGLQAITGPVYQGGRACLVPVQMALQAINARQDLLDGYKLVYEYFDHECVQGTAVYKMTRHLYERPPYLMVTGPILSTIAMATGQVSYHWNLTQLAFAASSPTLEDSKRFPKFYRLGSPDRKLNVVRLKIMDMFNWNKVATIHHASEFYSTVVDHFTAAAREANVTITSQQVFLHDPTTQIQTLKEQDVRIVLGAMYEDRARALLCAAYKQGFYGTKIVWFLMGFMSLNFWTHDLENVDCTLDEMNTVAEGTFLIKSSEQAPVDNRGFANITHADFWEEFHNHPNYTNETKGFDPIGDNCYDGIWMTALAMNCTIDRMRQIGHPKTLDQFTYADGDINEIIYECLGNSSFMGVSGMMSFPDGNDPDRTVQIERVQNGERILLGYYIKDTIPHHFQWIEGALQWKDGVIPRDSTRVIKQETVIPTSLYVVLCMTSVLGIMMAISFFTFNVVFKNNRTVKMSSPNMNNVLLIGCIMCYCAVFIKTVEVSNAILCKVRSFCFSLGFTTIFGSLFSKTWRVYRIFTNSKALRMSIKDGQLLAINGVLFAIMLLLHVTWEIIAPLEVVVEAHIKEVYLLGNDEEIHPFVRVCHSNYGSYFGWTIYILEGALLAFGAFLAWETRRVKISGLNDSHQIGLCLYNVVILSAVGLTLSLLLDEQDVMLYGVTSGCLNIGTTFTQLMIFVPKVYAIYHKVGMEDTAKTNSRSGTSGSNTQPLNKSGPKAGQPIPQGSSGLGSDTGLGSKVVHSVGHGWNPKQAGQEVDRTMSPPISTMFSTDVTNNVTSVA